MSEVTPRGAPHPFMLELQGGSMEPTLCRGWRVLVEPLTALPRPGDVVAIRGRNGVIVHRVVHVAERRATTRVYHAGDAVTAAGRCTRDAVIGRVVAVVDTGQAERAGLRPLPTAIQRPDRWMRWRCRADATFRAAVDWLARPPAGRA